MLGNTADRFEIHGNLKELTVPPQVLKGKSSVCEPRLEASPKARDSPTSASQGFFVQALAVGAAGSETGRLYLGKMREAEGPRGPFLGP